jgi:diguanylate cyclase (GGDEF)-like protein/PAS domain S-box-containing protein
VDIQSDLSAINERLNFALQSARQVAFEWSVTHNKLDFHGELPPPFKSLLIDSAERGNIRELPAKIHSDDVAHFRRYLRRALKGKSSDANEIYSIELRLKSHQGGWHWIDIKGKVTERDEKGHALHMIGIFSDIHKRKQMETALVESEKFKNAILTAGLDCIVSINHEGEIISFNQTAEISFGYRSAEVLGKKMADMIIPPELREAHKNGMARYLAGGASRVLNRRIELTAMRSDHSTFPIELTIVPIDIQGNPIFTAFIRDISELKKNQAILKDNAIRYRQLVELSPEAIFVHRDKKLILVNQAGLYMLGAQSIGEIIGRNVFDFIHPDCHPVSRERERKLLAGLPSTPFLEQVWIRLDNTTFHTEVAASNLIYDGTPVVQAVVRDISERKLAEQIQAAQNKILNMIATGVALFEILTHIAQFIEAQSDRGLCSILLLGSDGLTVTTGASPSLPASYNNAINGAHIGPANGSCGTAIYRAAPVIVTDIANDPLWSPWRDLALDHGLKACTSWPIFGKNRRILGSFALYFRDTVAPSAKDLQLFDISTNLAGIAIESRESEERIRYLAHYDGLTALPNRFLFKEYLDLALRNAQRHRQKFAVFFLDLDGFKSINDTYGHEAGDMVLQEVARRLRTSLRLTDKVARMGGDEFYILIEDLMSACYASEVAQKILHEVSRSMQIGNQECSLSASIGIVIYPDDCSNGPELLKNADGAMYRAKESGKNTYQLYSMKQDTSTS